MELHYACIRRSHRGSILNRHFFPNHARRGSAFAHCRMLAMGMILGATLCAANSSAGANVSDRTTPEGHTAGAPVAATPAAAPLAAASAAPMSAGCGKPGKYSTGVLSGTAADGKGRTRTFRMQVPARL